LAAAILWSDGLQLGPEPVLADTPFAVTINATYSNGVLTASGTYTWSECPSSKKAAAFAIFVDGASPDSPGTGALYGADDPDTMRPVDMTGYVFPCVTSGDWGPDMHPLPSAPQQVCVVLYDVHDDNDDKLPPKTGKHSTVGAGTDKNKDNSYNKSGPSKPADSYGPGACTVPVAPTPTPTPTAVPTTATPPPTASSIMIAPMPTVMQVALPPTGDSPSGSLSPGLPFLVAAGLAVAALASGSIWLLARSRRDVA
jgi:hypothetical protein